MPTNRKTYYSEHLEQCRENSRIYAQKNRETIREKQREYYYKTLKARRRVDKMWADADKPPKPVKPEPKIKTTKRFLAATPVAKNPRKPRTPKVHPDLSTVQDIPVPSSGVTRTNEPVTIDWNNM